MLTHFNRHSLGRQIVAIAAAYVIALSTAIASFAAGRIAAETAGNPLGVICHTEDAGTPSRSGDDGDVKHCVDSCSLCCLTAAALPPLPSALPRTALPIAGAMPFAAPVLAGRPVSKSHRSRAPPQAV